jgi:hypothetical protein
LYTFKIETAKGSEWNKSLLKTTSANFFQSVEYLSSDSKEFFPIFISILDENGNVVGQLGLTVIKSTVLYSSSSFRSLLRLIAKITTRGIWLYGPIIHSDNKQERVEILQTIINANDEICKKYDLVFIEGYTSPYDSLVDDEYKQQFTNNGYIVSDFVTFIADMSKPIDAIWNAVSKKTRGDVNRAKRRNIIVKELSSYDELREYLILHNTWAKTKGLELINPFQDIEKLWNNHTMGVEKFFLAYQSDQLISALRLTCFNGIVYTHFVLSSYSDSTSLGGTLLTWSALEWAKNSGMKLYDFSGGPKQDNKNSLVFYKKKWGGEEYVHYNLIKAPKKYHYLLYKLLFSLVRSYHNFKGKRYKAMTQKEETEQELPDL